MTKQSQKTREFKWKPLGEELEHLSTKSTKNWIQTDYENVILAPSNLPEPSTLNFPFPLYLFLFFLENQYIYWWCLITRDIDKSNCSWSERNWGGAPLSHNFLFWEMSAWDAVIWVAQLVLLRTKCKEMSGLCLSSISSPELSCCFAIGMGLRDHKYYPQLLSRLLRCIH